MCNMIFYIFMSLLVFVPLQREIQCNMLLLDRQPAAQRLSSSYIPTYKVEETKEGQNKISSGF